MKKTDTKKYQNEWKEKYEGAESLLGSCCDELQFANMQIEIIYNALDEIRSITKDPLTKKVAEMAIERMNIDKMIHARLLFRD